ncbi:MAG: hypothetical protein QOC86_802 [Gaiellales bacterium]|nr:hypothetical protein [Gaiellales bacterium]
MVRAPPSFARSWRGARLIVAVCARPDANRMPTAGHSLNEAAQVVVEAGGRSGVEQERSSATLSGVDRSGTNFRGLQRAPSTSRRRLRRPICKWIDRAVDRGYRCDGAAGEPRPARGQGLRPAPRRCRTSLLRSATRAQACEHRADERCDRRWRSRWIRRAAGPRSCCARHGTETRTHWGGCGPIETVRGWPTRSARWPPTSGLFRGQPSWRTSKSARATGPHGGRGCWTSRSARAPSPAPGGIARRRCSTTTPSWPTGRLPSRW